MSPPRSIRIFSWNINGIAPYIPSPSPKITSYFKPSASQPNHARKTTTVSVTTANNPSALTVPSIRAFLARHGFPHVLFLQELKLAPSSPRTVPLLAALEASVNTPLHPADNAGADTRAYRLDAVLPQDRRNARGAVYGVATLLRRDVARAFGGGSGGEEEARARPTDWDREGRMQVVELFLGDKDKSEKEKGRSSSGISNSKLALVNVYAVNGTSAPYRDPDPDPEETMSPTLGTRHDFKRAFHARLRDECLALQRRGFAVVVAGDANVARGPLDGWPRLRTWPAEHCVSRAHFNATFFGREDNERAGAHVTVRNRELPEGPDGETGAVRGAAQGQGQGGGTCLDAVDVFRGMYGAERRYTYYPRTKEWGASCDRVDMVMVSRSLWEAGRVVGTGILDTPQERGLSDHVPIWVEVAVDEPHGQSRAG